MDYAVGVDAGDTFTDAVLFDQEEERIEEVTKVRTTHDDLSRGIFEAIDEVIGKIDPDNVIQVSLSSTLATNSIVEGRGGPVGLLTLGWKPSENQEFPRSRRGYVPGRFNPRGEELEPLDEERAATLVEEWKDQVVGFAVSGYFGVRNPTHENRVRKIIEEKTSRPIITGHDLSPQLGFYERAVTAVLNVKVVPIINSFIDSAKSALRERGIHAPLLVVKSDGTLAKSGEVKKKPIETVFSGPAASAIGARWLSNKDDGVVIDIGGTTVDVAVLRNGLPTLANSGVSVGKWRTKVRSMDLRSNGLGGDSQIELDKEGNLVFGPRTAMPLAFGDLSEELLDKVDLYEDASFVEKRKGVGEDLSQLTDSEVKFYKLIGDEMMNRSRLMDIAREEGLIRGNYYLRKLERLGLVRRVALTPTDLLHVIGEYTAGSREAPRIGTDVLARERGQEPARFASQVKESFEKEISYEVVKKFILEEKPGCEFEGNSLWYYCKDEGTKGMSVKFELDYPVIGVGAPAGVFLPRVAENLGADFLEVENFEVGNAVGAVTGRVSRRIDVLVVEKPETEEFLVFLPDNRKTIEVEDEEVAMDEAVRLGKRSASNLVRESGGEDINLHVSKDPFNHGRGKVHVTAVGTPSLN
ncbi:hydantoinase/oxoprolinase family protein [Candidatus Bipolaricaulota bacterium]|nr:hydantoinase/oxoprolinase family protein [Candidatus Bipolaricaulota bacterium]MBS3791149.1 hydantoinase/oxoprolinase family protein [Candidatus Bipolaricaulota bacterium]